MRGVEIAGGERFKRPLLGYGDSGLPGLWQVLRHRIDGEPLNLVAKAIFAARIRHLGHAVQAAVFRLV